MIRKSGKEIHPAAVKISNPKDKIHIVLFEITIKELEETDKYEVSNYKRVLESFNSGK